MPKTYRELLVKFTQDLQGASRTHSSAPAKSLGFLPTIRVFFMNYFAAAFDPSDAFEKARREAYVMEGNEAESKALAMQSALKNHCQEIQAYYQTKDEDTASDIFQNLVASIYQEIFGEVFGCSCSVSDLCCCLKNTEENSNKKAHEQFISVRKYVMEYLVGEMLPGPSLRVLTLKGDLNTKSPYVAQTRSMNLPLFIKRGHHYSLYGCIGGEWKEHQFENVSRLLLDKLGRLHFKKKMIERDHPLLSLEVCELFKTAHEAFELNGSYLKYQSAKADGGALLDELLATLERQAKPTHSLLMTLEADEHNIPKQVLLEAVIIYLRTRKLWEQAQDYAYLEKYFKPYIDPTTHYAMKMASGMNYKREDKRRVYPTPASTPTKQVKALIELRRHSTQLPKPPGLSIKIDTVVCVPASDEVNEIKEGEPPASQGSPKILSLNGASSSPPSTPRRSLRPGETSSISLRHERNLKAMPSFLNLLHLRVLHPCYWVDGLGQLIFTNLAEGFCHLAHGSQLWCVPEEERKAASLHTRANGRGLFKVLMLFLAMLSMLASLGTATLGKMGRFSCWLEFAEGCLACCGLGEKEVGEPTLLEGITIETSEHLHEHHSPQQGLERLSHSAAKRVPPYTPSFLSLNVPNKPIEDLSLEHKEEEGNLASPKEEFLMLPAAFNP